MFRAESSLSLRKPSIRNDDDTTLLNSHSTSFFSINNLSNYGSNRELNSIHQDSLDEDGNYAGRRHSKRKQLFRINSVDDSVFK